MPLKWSVDGGIIGAPMNRSSTPNWPRLTGEGAGGGAIGRVRFITASRGSCVRCWFVTPAVRNGGKTMGPTIGAVINTSTRMMNTGLQFTRGLRRNSISRFLRASSTLTRIGSPWAKIPFSRSAFLRASLMMLISDLRSLQFPHAAPHDVARNRPLLEHVAHQQRLIAYYINQSRNSRRIFTD